MADYTNSVGAGTSNLPMNAVDGQDWSRYEPLITPTVLTRRYLLGIPLVSFMKNPITGRPDVVTPDDLKDFILRAVAKAESDLQIDIFPVQRSERQDFDRNLVQNYGHMRLNQKPILSVEKVAVRPNGGVDLYQVPLDWINPGYFTKGVIHINPLMPSIATNTIPSQAGTGGVFFLQIIQGRGWIPAFWVVDYTTGFKDGAIPRIINELIGCYAAMDILGMLQATRTNTSHSINLDGIGQSISGPGPQIYKGRIDQLDAEAKKIVQKLKGIYNTKIVMGNI
jgi:hypothetical protein